MGDEPNMRRFFVPAEALTGEEVRLTGDLARRLGRVLRLQPGDVVLLLDGSGFEYETRLERLDDRSAFGRVLERRPGPPEPQVRLVLYQSLVKGERFDWVLEKGTELGVAAFVPLLAGRAVRRTSGEGTARLDRWRRVVREAAEQCGRSVLPDLSPPRWLAEALQAAPGLKILPYERETAHGLREALPPLREEPLPAVSLFIGPEGGFSEEEVSLARAAGAVTVSLGPRILRSETAGIVAAAAVMYELGELGARGRTMRADTP